MPEQTHLDYDALRQYAAENISGLIFVTVSGAHLYGFPSPDSDVDLRGTFAAPLDQVLSLDKPRETRETAGIVDGTEVELVGHELEKYLRLLVKPNGYVLEQILSPLVVLTAPAHQELKALAQASLSRRLYYHYAGFAHGQWQEYQKAGASKTVKRLLYLHRVLMTGILLLTEGMVECDLHRLTLHFGLDLSPLIAAKTREQALVIGSAAPYEASVRRLFERLEEARTLSPLPEDVPNRADFSDFLVRVRLPQAGLSSRTTTPARSHES